MSSHRPTYRPAKAIENAGGYKRWVPTTAVSSKALPGYLTLKTRQPGQNTREEVAGRDLKHELKERESKLSNNNIITSSSIIEEEQEQQPFISSPLQQKASEEKNIRVITDSDEEDDHLASSDDELPDDDKHKNNAEEGEVEETDDDDDDSDVELERELERIRKEREEEALRKKKEEEERLAKEETFELLTSNPLLRPVFDKNEENGDDTSSVYSDASSISSIGLKRKWDEDTVFKNQARDEPQTKKRFINDTIRSDFHKRFLEKYIK
jgi:protein CWC15